MEFITGTYILILAVSFVLYFIPMMIAFHRHHENYTAIFMLNLLLGWTGVVWVICLVWAFISKPLPLAQSDAPGKVSRYEELERISALRSSGALTSEEFDREKSRILK
ncbi:MULTISPECIES: superinfection immunity protein [Pseudomonas]|uniref:Superinfection immunity protein n=1 Tax=Pseudomonas juntendi TaxID=2666183 RepID=A0A7W2LVV8_9PSED|nr:MULTISPECIES: superinfection immunity protein [Pseudomonas]EGB96812.1 peptidase [Pseudomonas sp. TJI-51]MBA6132139.1 superinfection immunity protein [Pseudomonas juntendi]MBA6148010.1 superinfection immunity protein [Pseudomonas juntendi]MBI6913501.1 superinfection immunity protein [Pseudomonas juntendi]MCK2110683.1 superinfection immunity protein [Pseudomonas juntendi]